MARRPQPIVALVPPQDGDEPVTRVLYAFHNERAGLVKIGVTSDVPRRRRALEFASGCDLHLLGTEVWRTPTEARLRESILHRLYADYRTVGEWFALPAGVVADLERQFARPLWEVGRG